MATLKDIAAKCNTSITTVSRVLNYDKTLSVSDKLRRKIIETATTLNYQSPHKKKTKTPQVWIGIVHWYDDQTELEDPYYLDIRKGIESSASNYHIKTTLLYKQNACDCFDLDRIHGVDGIIAIGKFNDEQIQSFSALTHHIVFVDSSPDTARFDSVVIDFESAVKDVVKKIVTQGYQTIGYLGGVEQIGDTLYLGERREIIFKEQLSDYNLLLTKHIHIGKFTLESGYAMMQDILKKEPYADVYFCANDSIAMGAMRAIHEHQLNIPNDIALIGFNDIAMSAYMSPPLSTVKVFTYLLGEEAVESLIARMQRRHIPLRKVLPTTFIYRQTFVKGDTNE